MKIKLIRKIKQRIRDISNVWSVAGIRNVYVMAILPHFGSKSTRDIRRERKQQAILHYLQTNYQNLILKYTQKEEIPPASNQAPIWVCWWQGENAMPPIVQSCFQSLCSHAGNHLVHLITQENISKYVTIPDYILRKVQEGKISFTHFSDILRMCLLYEHGGLWIDATVYVSQPIPEKVLNLASVRRSLNSIPTDHSQIFDLENMMNKAYNANSFKTLCEQQIFHKLSYKNKHAQYTNKGVRTLYHMLISK